MGFESPINLINILSANIHPIVLQSYSYKNYEGYLAQDVSHWVMSKGINAYDEAFQIEYSVRNGKLNATKVIDFKEPECQHFVLNGSSDSFLFGTYQLFYV